MKGCIDHFFAALGSKVSFDKSRVFFSNNTKLDFRDDICNELDMQVTLDFWKYLGVPTTNGRTTNKITIILWIALTRTWQDGRPKLCRWMEEPLCLNADYKASKVFV